MTDEIKLNIGITINPNAPEEAEVEVSTDAVDADNRVCRSYYVGEADAVFLDMNTVSMYIGQHVLVTQEVMMEDCWSPIEYSGWVASVVWSRTDGELLLDTGDTYTIMSEDVRNTTIRVVDTVTKPDWERYPDRWIAVDGHWEPDYTPKVEGAECFRCSLLNYPIADSPTRTKSADVLHIAEAPGRNEVQDQEFMVGRSGKLYYHLLKQILAGYTSTINNACMCFGDTPGSSEIDACRKRLDREIEMVQPKLIVAVGAIALKALTGLDGITEYQGMLLTDHSPPIIPCFHPAALLRRPELFPDLVNALSKAKLFLDGSDLIDVQPHDFMRQIATQDDSSYWLSQLAYYPKLYCDLETTGFNPFTDDILCASIAGGDDTGIKLSVVFPWEYVKDSADFKRLIETVDFGYYNGYFDCQFLRSAGIKAFIGCDVMLKQYTVDERPTAQSLKYVARRYANAPDWEAPLKPYLPTRTTSYAEIPRDILYEYANLDGCYTGTVDLSLDRLMNDDNRSVYSTILLPVANMLLDVCRVGIKVDTAQLEVLRPELAHKIEDLREELMVMADREFNPGSVKQLKEVLYDLFQYEGATGRAILEEHFSGELFVDKLLEFRTTRKMLGTYIEGLVDDIVDGRIHPNLRLNGTVTGRLSASSPNMLGMPKEKGGIKKLFVADDGYLLMEADGSQMEVRGLGALAHDTQMIADFRNGVDFHGEARNRCFGRGTSKELYTHQEILDAKTGVFGPIYGRGAYSMARLLKCSVEEAQLYIDKLWEPYGISWDYMLAREKEVHQKGMIRSYYGRYRRWGLITEDNAKNVEHEARNFPVSSTSNDTNLLVMLATYNEYSREDILPLLPVHDSILCRVRKDGARELALGFKDFCSRKAQELLDTEMPFEYEVTLGPSWGEQQEVE